MTWIKRVERSLWWAYLFWMGVGFVVTCAGFTAAKLDGLNAPEPLKIFVGLCLRYGDAILMLLAAMNTHLWASQRWGARPARNWAMLVLLLSGLVETVGTLTGFPFGVYHYTENFGPRLGGVLPLAIPLAWFVLVTNAILIVRPIFSLGRTAEALVVGAMVTGIDWVMEPFAVRIKTYWYWEHSEIPLQNYVAWFVVSFLLVRFLAPLARPKEMLHLKPWIVLGSMLALFIVARLLHGV